MYAGLVYAVIIQYTLWEFCSLDQCILDHLLQCQISLCPCSHLLLFSFNHIPVHAVSLTADGTTLFSGGAEGVLVVWHNVSTTSSTGASKSFFPRLGCPISFLTNNSRYVSTPVTPYFSSLIPIFQAEVVFL